MPLVRVSNGGSIDISMLIGKTTQVGNSGTFPTLGVSVLGVANYWSGNTFNVYNPSGDLIGTGPWSSFANIDVSNYDYVSYTGSGVFKIIS